MKKYRGISRGTTLIEVVVGIAIILVIFTGLVTLLSTSLKLSTNAKDLSIATSIAEGQIEFVRSLGYSQIGTLGGIPAGPIPQFATTTSNGIEFVTRTFIEYIDDPFDGIGAADTNGIPTDYKKIKVTTFYTIGTIPHQVSVISNYAPPGIETAVAGGTLKIKVVNAAGVGILGASVHIVNSAISPTVDVTTFSSSDGSVSFPGAATSTEYEVYVSKTGYSSAQTYIRDTTNVNPTPGYMTVAQNLTTTGTFAIDLFNTLRLQTFYAVATSTYTDTFSTSDGISALSNAAVAGGAIILSGGPVNYAPSGSVTSGTIIPTYLNAWSSVTFSDSTPGGSDIRVHVRNASGALLTDAVLPGNAAGFTNTIDLSSVATSTYPTLVLSADLTTDDPDTTPFLNSWTVTYLRGPVPFPNKTFTLTGSKTIGATAGSVPILKTIISTSTDASSTIALPLEWDAYALTLPGYDFVSICNRPPYALAPGGTLTTSLLLGTSTTNSLLVSINSSSVAVPGALVTLSRSGYTSTVSSDSCGSAYFGGIGAATDYALSVVKTGYTTFSATNLSVSGKTNYESILAP
jgi:type II secretory pathway pseudopilin PulG